MSDAIERIEIWFTPGGRIRRPRIAKFVADGHDLTPMVAPLSEVSIQLERYTEYRFDGDLNYDIAKVTVAMIGRVIVRRVKEPR